MPRAPRTTDLDYAVRALESRVHSIQGDYYVSQDLGAAACAWREAVAGVSAAFQVDQWHLIAKWSMLVRVQV